MLREKAGTPELVMELPESATVADLLKKVEERFPGLPIAAPVTMIAVNAEYVEESHPLHDGDEVALIPPVSGGAGSAITTARARRHSGPVARGIYKR